MGWGNLLTAIVGFILEAYVTSVFVRELLKLIQDSPTKNLVLVGLSLAGLIAIPLFIFRLLRKSRID